MLYYECDGCMRRASWNWSFTDATCGSLKIPVVPENWFWRLAQQPPVTPGGSPKRVLLRACQKSCRTMAVKRRKLTDKLVFSRDLPVRGWRTSYNKALARPAAAPDAAAADTIRETVEAALARVYTTFEWPRIEAGRTVTFDAETAMIQTGIAQIRTTTEE